MRIAFTLPEFATVQEVERAALRAWLAARLGPEHRNRAQGARHLGITDRQLQYLLERLGVTYADVRPKPKAEFTDLEIFK